MNLHAGPGRAEWACGSEACELGLDLREGWGSLEGLGGSGLLTIGEQKANIVEALGCPWTVRMRRVQGYKFEAMLNG